MNPPGEPAGADPQPAKSIGEFELIERYFGRRAAAQLTARALDTADPTASVIDLGIGDDCALISPRQAMAISTDSLVQGVHFFDDVEPRSLGHKALAVNLSDLAAIGARPSAFTLALTLPALDETWLSEFSAGLFDLAQAHRCALIGGDTTRGPLNLCITVFGDIDVANALRRDRAAPGDDCWVSGELGAAAWAVALRRDRQTVSSAAARHACARLDRPAPRVELGQRLIGLANAAIDVSDGLLADFRHIARRSAVRIELDSTALPIDAALNELPLARRLRYALAGGDDYELAFTAGPNRRAQIIALGAELGLALTRIGAVSVGNGVALTGSAVELAGEDWSGFDHFK